MNLNQSWSVGHFVNYGYWVPNFFFYLSFMDVQVQLSPFSPHHSPPPSHPHLPPSNLPPLALSLCPLYIYLSYIYWAPPFARAHIPGSEVWIMILGVGLIIWWKFLQLFKCCWEKIFNDLKNMYSMLSEKLLPYRIYSLILYLQRKSRNKYA